MCLGIPARIESTSGLWARAVNRDGACEVDLALTGPLPPGSWVLTFQGTAREVIDAARARDIDAALDALVALACGETNVDAYFADLINRQPVLPAHLQKGNAS
ncbi:MAG: HypC/HybG/HupF family hydrogenase formation chaperone [Zoogloeaceae bacterium]|jgi:hydrogenase expression/formation protein HypC|nr:HypC/HybG/HupF family hydrogenase formation chaperone [Zoogloeaceae bacterium]